MSTEALEILVARLKDSRLSIADQIRTLAQLNAWIAEEVHNLLQIAADVAETAAEEDDVS